MCMLSAVPRSYPCLCAGCMKVVTDYPMNCFPALVPLKVCGLFTGKDVVLLFQRYSCAFPALIKFGSRTLRLGVYTLD